MRIRYAALTLVGLLMATHTQAGWEFYEKTNVKGKISDTIKKDHVIQMQSGSIYQVSELTLQLVLELAPEALVFKDSQRFKVVIDGFDAPLICKQLVAPKADLPRTGKSLANPPQPKVIQSKIDGNFEGWEGETIFKLDNGQIWQQASYAYKYHYAYHPEVMIMNVNGTWKMKVEGVDERIDVKRLK